MSSDPNEFDYDDYDENPSEPDPNLENEAESEPREIFGMSMVEIGILGGLLLAILILGGFVGIKIINNARTENISLPTPEPPTLTPSATPFVKSTPIPGWNKFTFAEENAEIWLPTSFQGGDPAAYLDILEMTIDVFLPEESRAEFAKDIIADSAIAFFGFDSDPSVIWRSMYVKREPLSGTASFDMDEYLNQVIENAGDRNIRVTNQYLTDLDYYSNVGVLIFEEHDEIAEGESYLFKNYLFAVQIEGVTWNLVYKILRDDAAGFQETIFNSARSFYVQP